MVDAHPPLGCIWNSNSFTSADNQISAWLTTDHCLCSKPITVSIVLYLHCTFNFQNILCSFVVNSKHNYCHTLILPPLFCHIIVLVFLQLYCYKLVYNAQDPLLDDTTRLQHQWFPESITKLIRAYFISKPGKTPELMVLPALTELIRAK